MNLHSTKYYVKTYHLHIDNKFSHNQFINDFKHDFNELLSVGNALKSLKGFNNAVNAIRSKWDAINNKTVGNLPNKLWNYFYAVEIIQLKKTLFPEYFEEQERKRKQKQEHAKQWENYNHFNSFS